MRDTIASADLFTGGYDMHKPHRAAVCDRYDPDKQARRDALPQHAGNVRRGGAQRGAVST